MNLHYDDKMDAADVMSSTPPATCEVKNGQKSPNRLYHGDNLNVLRALCDDSAVAGKVQMVYIDPPYATKRVFKHRKRADDSAYDDGLTGSEFLEFIRRRLILLREILCDDGCIYVHLDARMAFHVKVIMDEVFGPSNFRNFITRQKCHSKNYTSNQYGNVADYILFYSRGRTMKWNRPYEEANKYSLEQRYPRVEENTGRRFALVPIYAPGVRNGETGQPWRGMNPPDGKHWQPKPSELDRLDAAGEIHWSVNGNPRRKLYQDRDKGVPVHDIWTKHMDFRNQNMKETGYPTEKNAALLRRLIEASSNPGDYVLDCFCGSGTTLAVAGELGRRWLGVDSSDLAIATTVERIKAAESHRLSQPELFDRHEYNGQVIMPTAGFSLIDATTPQSSAHQAS